MKGFGILWVAKQPTTINKVHESLYRSNHILALVERLLELETPSKVILEILRELKYAEQHSVHFKDDGIPGKAIEFVDDSEQS